jgi:arylsulfatase A-like enzyme
MKRSLHITFATGLLGALGACAAAPAADIHWDELSRVAGSFRGTDLISRADPGSLKALGRGWTIDTDTTIDRGFWGIGLEARFDIVVVRDGAHDLVFDVIPPDDMSNQLISVRVNGVLVGEPIALPLGWSRQRLRLRAEDVVPGHNRVRFAFRGVARPNDRDPEAGDDRPLAARFRFLQLEPLGSDRALAEDADPDLIAAGGEAAPVETVPIPPAGRTGNTWTPVVLEPTDESGRKRLVIAADSIVQVAINVPTDAHLVGTAAIVADESGDSVEWIAEVVEPGGTRHEVDRGSEATLDADLSRFAGQDVMLRLRTIGSRGTAIIWSDLGVSDPGSEFDHETLTPPALPVAAKSDRFGKPDIIVIMLDAARPDFMSTYRGIAPTPAIDALAADGTRFENAYAAAPWTNQSVYSMMSGRYPEAHGVAGWRDLPPRDIRTLFQLTYAAGYHTALWSEHPLYRASRALRYDLDQYIDIKPRERMASRERLNQADIFVPDQPTFALFHLLPPHAPYVPDEFGGPAPEWSDSMMKGFSTDFDLSPAALQGYSRSVGDRVPTEADLRYITARYQDNLRYADELVRRIIEGLKRANRYDNALIMLVSDHGEAFYEHGHFLHTWPLYDETLRIPMIIKWPGNAGTFQRSVDRRVSNVDIAPTIIDAIGNEGEDPGHQGRSLLPLVFDGFFPSRSIYASTVGVANGAGDDEPLQPMTALIAPPYKVIHDKLSGHVELYDLDADPRETTDMAGSHPVLVQQILQALFLQEQASLLLNAGAEAGGVDVELDPELIETLRALGYLQ